MTFVQERIIRGRHPLWHVIGNVNSFKISTEFGAVQGGQAYQTGQGYQTGQAYQTGQTMSAPTYSSAQSSNTPATGLGAIGNALAQALASGNNNNAAGRKML